MKVAKVIENFFILLCVVGITKIIALAVLDNRPLKFERYTTADAFEEAIKLSFPVGSDLDQAADILKRSRARCEGPENIHYMEYKTVLICNYVPEFISILPIGQYHVELYGDKNNKVLSQAVYVIRWLEGLM